MWSVEPGFEPRTPPLEAAATAVVAQGAPDAWPRTMEDSAFLLFLKTEVALALVSCFLQAWPLAQ